LEQAEQSKTRRYLIAWAPAAVAVIAWLANGQESGMGD
jgi:hypothetical protein